MVLSLDMMNVERSVRFVFCENELERRDHHAMPTSVVSWENEWHEKREIGDEKIIMNLRQRTSATARATARPTARATARPTEVPQPLWWRGVFSGLRVLLAVDWLLIVSGHVFGFVPSSGRTSTLPYHRTTTTPQQKRSRRIQWKPTVISTTMTHHQSWRSTIASQ